MKRRVVTRVIVFLLLGAIINVAVAWGLARWSHLLHAPATVEVPREHLLDPANRYVYLAMVTESRSPGALRGARLELLLPEVLDSGNNHVQMSAEPRNRRTWTQQAGWPAFSVSDTNIAITPSETAVKMGRPPEFNIDAPIWPGFAVNTVFYASILWLLFTTSGVIRRAVRRRCGLCPACGYPVGQSPLCTECGAGVSRIADQ